jgi:TusA-related sulfurtransferase
MLRSRVAVFVLGAALFACSKPKADPVTAAPAPPPPAAPVAAAPPAEPTPATPSGKMAHCPSTVVGANTAIEDTPGGIALTVTAAEESAVKEIRARAAFLGASAQNDATPIGHNGTGEGGGIFGRCPVVMRNTKVAVTDVKGGSKLVVASRDAKEQDWLRRESRSRLAEIGSPGSVGAGVGKMAHCPNAVKGATTAISDGPGAVAITITAKDDEAVKQIRDRAKQIVLASQKTESGEIKHDGSGNGGGGFGRCPIVLKDTSVVEKDAPGGALFTVTPKNAKDLPSLKQQVRERSMKFD